MKFGLQLYGNEREVGRAVRGSGLEREEVFVTTKLWESEWGYRKASGAIQDRSVPVHILRALLLPS